MNEQTDLIQYTKKRSLCRRLLPLLLAMGLLLVGCSGGTEPSEPSSDTGSSTASASSTPAASAPEPEPEPETLEQELLKKRGVAFDQSDYKTFTGAEGVLSLQTVFSDLNPKKAGGNLSSVFLSGGKIYQYRCDATLPGGQNCREVGTLPLAEQPVYLQANDFNGADLEVVYRGGKRYSVKSASNNGPYTATESKYLHPVLTHAWRYNADGKTLTEDVGLRDSEDGYIVYEVADEAVGDGEKAVAILNGNILATDQAFYQIMYDDISENDLSYEEKTTNADGTPAAYLPKFGGGNRYRLVKLELLSRYYSDVWRNRVKPALDRLCNGVALDPHDYTGRNSLRNLAEMEVRYADHLDNIADLKAEGERLVVCSAHADCSDRCAPWQGRVYSLDGTSGVIDGNRYVPLERATDIYYTTKAGRVYKNGLLGFNCRHKLYPYRGELLPVISAEERKAEYEVTKRQRAMERDVRRAKTSALMLKDINKAEYIRQRDKAKALYRAYIRYSMDNNRAYYPMRVTI